MALLAVLAAAVRAETIQHVAYTDALCTHNPRVLSSLALGECQAAWPTSPQLSFVCIEPDCPQGLGCSGGACPAGTLVITGVQNDTTCAHGCDGGCSQFSDEYPSRCDEYQTADITLYSKYVRVSAPCQPDCRLCRGIYGLAQCDYVPSTVPPTPFGEALPGCVGCGVPDTPSLPLPWAESGCWRAASALRDNAGCGCAPCFAAAPTPHCAPGEFCPPPPGPRGPPGCLGGMCAGALGVPCMDCGTLSGGNSSRCAACMRERVDDPALGGACDFMAQPGGLCSPENC